MVILNLDQAPGNGAVDSRLGTAEQAMPLILTITSSHKDGLGDTANREFGIAGGTIGRSVENDWVLPDSKRYVSSRHCTIDFRGGCYYLIDTSTNGVYVNESDIPVGRGNPQRLFAGDQLRIGEYQVQVQIEGDQTMEMLAHDGYRKAVDEAQQVAAPDPTRDDLLNVTDITGAVELQQLLDECAGADTIKLAAEAAAAALSLEETLERAAPYDASTAPAAEPQEPAPGESQTPNGTLGQSQQPSLDAFFRGAGLPTRSLDTQQTELLLQQLGAIVREMVTGVTESLHLRAEQKNALRLSHTTIQPRSNNPLKFSAEVEEALLNLLFQPSASYAAPLDAVREAFHDIRTHQRALLAAVHDAFQDYSEYLDPEVLQQRFDQGMKRPGLLSAANKIKYWELYGELYQALSEHQPGSFPRRFGDELARAYEEHVERLSNESKQSTQNNKPAA